MGRELNRRSLLRAIGATGVAMISVPGTTSAAPTYTSNKEAPSDRLETADEEAVRAYQTYISDESMIEQAFDEHIGSIAQLMESNGVSPPSSLAEAESIDLAPERKDGVPSAHIVARYNNGKTDLHLFPQANRAYAYVESKTGTKRFDPDNGIEIAATCGKSYNCACVCTSVLAAEVERCCLFPSGVTCEYLGRECDCPNPEDMPDC